MYWSSQSPEHRARELLNLVTLARRCARLPDIDDEERAAWQAEADRAWERARRLLPRLRDAGASGQEVLAMAEQVASEVSAPRGAARLTA